MGRRGLGRGENGNALAKLVSFAAPATRIQGASGEDGTPSKKAKRDSKGKRRSSAISMSDTEAPDVFGPVTKDAVVRTRVKSEEIERTVNVIEL